MGEGSSALNVSWVFWVALFFPLGMNVLGSLMIHACGLGEFKKLNFSVTCRFGGNISLLLENPRSGWWILVLTEWV